MEHNLREYLFETLQDPVIVLYIRNGRGNSLKDIILATRPESGSMFCPISQRDNAHRFYFHPDEVLTSQELEKVYERSTGDRYVGLRENGLGQLASIFMRTIEHYALCDKDETFYLPRLTD